jgi:hypothetical protein
MKRLPIVALVTVLGCSSSPTPPPTSDPDAALPPVVTEMPPTVRSGARLVAYGWRVGAAANLDHFHDLATDRDCVFGQHIDGSVRCMPRNVGLGIVYLDKACTDGVVLTDDELPTDEDFTVEDDPEVPTLLVGRAGEPVELEGVEMYYRYADGSCELESDEEDIAGVRFVPSAPETYVRATPTTLTGDATGRIVPRALEGEDGSRAPLPGAFSEAANAFLPATFVDVARDHEVAPTSIAWDAPYAGEVAWTERVGTPSTTRFTDAGCTQPLISLPSDSPAIGATIRPAETCAFATELHDVERATESYERDGDACAFVENLDNPNLGQLGALVDPSRYVRGTLALAAPEERLTALTVATEGATPAPLVLFDTDFQLPCVPRRLAADPTRAVCQPLSRNTLPTFGDAACTQRVLIARANDIASRSCYAGPPPRAALADAALPPTQVRFLIAGERIADDAPLFVQLGSACLALVDRATTFAVASDRVVDLAELSLEQLP